MLAPNTSKKTTKVQNAATVKTLPPFEMPRNRTVESMIVAITCVCHGAVPSPPVIRMEPKLRTTKQTPNAKAIANASPNECTTLDGELEDIGAPPNTRINGRLPSLRRALYPTRTVAS
jgi:hypothetical protein